MNVTDHSPLLESLRLREELQTTSDDARCRSSTAGNALRSSSGAAGSCGGCCSPPMWSASLSALLLAELLAPARDSVDAYSPQLEVLAFLATIPAWVVITKLYGLYDRDDERANHSTADEFGGRLPHGHGLHVARYRGHVRDRHRASVRVEARRLLGCRHRVRLRRPSRGEDAGAAERGLYPEHRHRRCGRRRPAGREEVPATTRNTGSTSSASSTPSRRSARRTWRTWRCSATQDDSPRSCATSTSSG